jgi:hypothetical protein
MRRNGVVVVIVAAVIVALGGATAWGANPFVDIAGNSHAANIDAIANAGITLGCDATHYCPATDVRRDQMASFLARLGGLNSGTTRNFPRANARSDIQSFCSAVKLSPRSFPGGPCQDLTTAIDADGTANPSVTLDVEGRPIISYFNGSTEDLKFARCATPSCSTYVSSTLASTGQVGSQSAITLGSNGNPLIAYYDSGNTDLYLSRCADLACASATSVPIMVTTQDAGRAPQIGVAGDGNPVFAFYNASTKLLQFAHCQNSFCSSTIDQVNLAPLGDDAGAMTIGSDGLPSFAYIDTGNDLMMFKCTTFSCSARTTPVKVDNGSTIVGTLSLTTGPDGFPLVAYFDGLSLKVAHCTALDCSASSVVTAAAGSNSGGTTTFRGEIKSLAVGVDGLPVIASSQRDTVTGFTRIDILRCRDLGCASSTSIVGPSFAASPSMVITPTGQALIAYDEALIGSNRVKAYREPLD